MAAQKQRRCLGGLGEKSPAMQKDPKAVIPVHSCETKQDQTSAAAHNELVLKLVLEKRPDSKSSGIN